MKYILIALSVQFGSIPGIAAPFQNLDFESANTNNIIPFGLPGVGSGTFGDLLTGWQVQAPNLSFPLTEVWLNGRGFGADGFVSLFDGNNNAAVGLGEKFPVYGKFSFAMNPTQHAPFSLLQVGDLPGDANELSFISYGLPVSVSINNSPLDLQSTPLGSDPFTLFPRSQVIADISRFAGKEVELKFTVQWMSLPLGAWGGLDNIAFLSVPEPSVWALFAGGAAVILGNCFRRKKSEREI